MIEYNSHDPKRIFHSLKVHSLAKLIGEMEALDSESLFVLQTAAIVHDVGIKIAEKKYGNCGGKLQEQEGPAIAEDFLASLNYEPEVIERVCYLVGHHHTYSHIEGMDYQILVEADFLVNFYEEKHSAEIIRAVYDRIFKTESGRDFCCKMFVF
jgi:HD superfamily phosphodiesterase